MPHRLRRLSTITLFVAALLALVIAPPPRAYADVPYQTYYKDHFDQQYRTQAAYSPAGILGRDLYISDPQNPGKLIHSPLQAPQDVFIDSRDHLYIADTGNNRIVHLDEQGKLVRFITVEESPLNRPHGLFINAKGDIYIADTGNRRIVRLNAEGRLQAVFERPESKLIPDSFKFDPVKLIVDKRGFMYIAALGGYQGLLQLDPQGEFQSFYGANQTAFSVVDAVKRLLYTREMYQREISKLPGSITSVDVGTDGFIYIVTKEVGTGQIKKLNIAGLDQLAGKGEFSDQLNSGVYGEVIRHQTSGTQPQLNDITVDADGNMTVVDTKLHVVSQYDLNGNLLFYWGGNTGDTMTKLGVVKMPSAVETNSKNELFIADSENHVVQKYELSEFGALVHEANRLTQDGRYEESESLWLEVSRMNGNYTPAIIGLAKAAYKKGEYERAELLFKEAGWARGYSDSFWQTRLLWFQQHFGTLMNVVIVLLAGWYIVPKLARRLNKKKVRWRRSRREPLFLQQLKHIGYLMRHPIDGFHAIRYEGKAGLLSSSIILVLSLASFGVMQAGTSFIFDPSRIAEVSIARPLIQFIVIWVCFTASNYLVSSLYQGEGRFRDVWYGSAYALFPLVLLGLPLTILSNVMTLSEQSIYSFLEYGLYGWVGLLFIWKVQGIQNYSFGETVIHLALSVCTGAVLTVFVFIAFSLSAELGGFIYSLYQEAVIR